MVLDVTATGKAGHAARNEGDNAIGANPNYSGTWLSKFINSKPISTNLPHGIYDKLSHPIKFKRPTASGSQSDLSLIHI